MWAYICELREITWDSRKSIESYRLLYDISDFHCGRGKRLVSFFVDFSLLGEFEQQFQELSNAFWELHGRHDEFVEMTDDCENGEQGRMYSDSHCSFPRSSSVLWQSPSPADPYLGVYENGVNPTET